MMTMDEKKDLSRKICEYEVAISRSHHYSADKILIFLQEINSYNKLVKDKSGDEKYKDALGFCEFAFKKIIEKKEKENELISIARYKK